MDDLTLIGGGSDGAKVVYGRGLEYRSARTMLSDIDLELFRGELFGVVGPPGAGKRDLLEVLAGIKQPASGQISMISGRSNGHSKHGAKPNRIAFVPRHQEYDGRVTPTELVLKEAESRGLTRQQGVDCAAHLLDECFLSNSAHQPAASLTTSMLRRLDVALALVRDPDLLVIDEPQSGIEEMLVEPFWRMLRKFTDRGVTIIAATNDFTQADYFDRVLLLDHGRIRAIGAPDDIRRETFGGEVLHACIEGLDRALMNSIISLPYVKRAIRLESDRVELLIEEYRRDKERLEKALQQAGYRSVIVENFRMPFDRIMKALTT